jgi:16S rRNA (guanine527-N7)-methyltransferase
MCVDVVQGDGFAARLGAAGAELGLSVEPQQSQSLLKYVSLLERWNAVHNLSAHESRGDLLVRLVFDGLALFASLARRVGAGPLAILDVGSGAGFPAVVLAVMNPAWSVTATDPVAKKAAFVRQAAGECGIGNLRMVQAKVEDMPGSTCFDVIVSRAFNSLGQISRLSQHLLGPHGLWVVEKGRFPTQELTDVRDGIDVFHVEPVKVPETSEERCLVWMRPTR